MKPKKNMKILISCMIGIFLSSPLLLLAQGDTENAAGIVFIEGDLKIDDGGVYLESSDCVYKGKYYLGGVLSEDTGDKKANKTNKKANKKAAKAIKKTSKKIAKADNQTLANQEIKGFFGEREGFISPEKITGPMFEPIATGLSPACDLTLLAIYGLYVETQRIKGLCRVLTYESLPSDGLDENLAFYNKDCKRLDYPDELKAQSGEIKSVLRQANTAVVVNLVAIGLVLANKDKIEAEIKKASPLQQAAGFASLAQAVAFQARILQDNKRLQDRIKEAEGIMKMVDKL
jgi:hypothetical protein